MLDQKEVKLSAANPIILLDMLKEMGCSQREIFSATHTNTDLLVNANNLVSFNQYQELIDRAIALTKNPAIGLEFGRRLSFTGHSNLGLGIIASKNFSELLEFCKRCALVINPAVGLEISTDKSHLYLDINEIFPWNQNQVFMVDTAFAMFSAVASLFDQEISHQLSYETKYPKPTNMEPYQKHLAGNIKFDGGNNRMTFPLGFCLAPLPLQNPSAIKQAEKELNQHLELIDNTHQQMAVIIKIMIAASPGKIPSLQELSSAFHISSRTLNRRFKAMGSNFKSVVNEVREELAIEYLATGNIPVEEIAFRLGYSDPSNFSKAFKSWTGYSPRQYVQQVLK